MCLPKEKGGMGFRHLRLFNLALLAKQGWWLQTNSSSLCFRVYKAKYFPSCDFVDENLGCQPSFAWRSIMAARCWCVVEWGGRWETVKGLRSGRKNGYQAQVRTRSLLRRELRGKSSVVSDLIDDESKEWKCDLVRQCFLPQDADTILSIPLSATGARDRVIWAENKNGRSTVKSAYKLAQEVQRDKQLAEGSDQSSRKQT